jgi:hypothetical protein
VSGAGLAIFNLFMIVPAMVYSALLFALYLAALAFYLSGIAITASGLAGNSELLLDLPSRYVQIDADDPAASARPGCRSTTTGIHVHEEGDGPDETSDDGRAASCAAPSRGRQHPAHQHRHGRRFAHHPDPVRLRHGARRDRPVPAVAGGDALHRGRHQALPPDEFSLLKGH